jgi:hypothetical protein
MRRATARLTVTLLLAVPAAGTAANGVFAEVPDPGIDFVHTHGGCGKYYFPEIMGAGGALLDYDGDGDLDVYLVQGERLCPPDADRESIPPDPLTDRLFRNDGPRSADDPTPRFVDVTTAAAVPAGGYGMGATVADYDNDGWPDLYVTNLRSNRLLRNRGNGTFEDVTVTSGTDDPRWSVSTTFFDYDNDGWLDLYVGNYVDYSITKQVPCVCNTGAVDYCAPIVYPDLADRLFRNLGNGTFEDVTGRSGLASAPGAALGVAAADFDGNGWIDLYVANDGMSNFLWMNQGDGTFADEALLRGCAINSQGQPEASMGVDLADFDRDGDDDLIITHLGRESNTLYENDGSGMFLDRSTATGLAAPSWNMTGFGTGWVDYDSDGWLDLLVVNGAAHYVEALRQARDPYPFHEPNQLYRNLGNGRFSDVTAEAGRSFDRSEVGRAALLGDLDNEGDTDLVVANNNGPARVLLNRRGDSRQWIGAELLRVQPAGAATRARIAISAPDEPPFWRRVRTTAGYGSAIDARVLVGLGERSGEVDLTILWDGQVRSVVLRDLRPGRYYRVVESPEGTTR